MLKKPNALSTSTVLYVGQIPYDWDEGIIKSVVCGSGKVVDIRLGFDYAGKNKGFCFVEYQTPQDAQMGMHLLSQVKLTQPGGQYKKLRIELSKEGLRSNSSPDYKPVINLDRSMLPPYVQLPQEMLANGPPIPAFNDNNLQEFGAQFANPTPNMIQTSMQKLFNQNYSPLPNLQNQSSSMQSLSLNPSLPLQKTDKISDTLSQIPPSQLIDLIANLKNILSGPNASRAAEIFQVSPQLASTISQALLLMGFIDSEVIQESMKSASSTPVPRPSQPQPQIYQMPQHQPALPQVPKFTQMPNTFNQMRSNPAHLPPPNKWPHLPPHTVAKLSALSPDQAELISQVLSLPVNQISSLPPDKQAMVTNIRSQYL